MAATEGARRRTFAVISHPDAGKSTLTEALALHARVIQEAGAIHGKAGMPDRVGRMAPGIPMGRAGTAEEVAAVILWLLSDEAAYVTGALLPVSGGR